MKALEAMCQQRRTAKITHPDIAAEKFQLPITKLLLQHYKQFCCVLYIIGFGTRYSFPEHFPTLRWKVAIYYQAL